MTDANEYYLRQHEADEVRRDREEEAFQERVDDLLPRYLYTESGMQRILGEMDCVEDLAADLATVCAALARNNRVVLEFALERIRDRLTAEGRALVEYIVANPQANIGIFEQMGIDDDPNVPSFLKKQAY